MGCRQLIKRRKVTAAMKRVGLFTAGWLLLACTSKSGLGVPFDGGRDSALAGSGGSMDTGGGPADAMTGLDVAMLGGADGSAAGGDALPGAGGRTGGATGYPTGGIGAGGRTGAGGANAGGAAGGTGGAASGGTPGTQADAAPPGTGGRLSFDAAMTPDARVAFDSRADVSRDCVPATVLRCGTVVSDDSEQHGRPDQWSGYSRTARLMSGPEMFYTFEATQTGNVKIALTDTTADLDLILLKSCAQWADASLGRSISFDAEAGKTYLLVIDGYAGAGGPFTLSVDCPG